MFACLLITEEGRQNLNSEKVFYGTGLKRGKDKQQQQQQQQQHQNEGKTAEHRERMVATPASYSGGPWFKCRHGDWIS
jgi:hypothetical protein